MEFVGRTFRTLEAKQDQNSTKNICSRLDGIGNQCKGITKKSSKPLNQCETQTASNAEICSSNCLICIFRHDPCISFKNTQFILNPTPFSGYVVIRDVFAKN